MRGLLLISLLWTGCSPDEPGLPTPSEDAGGVDAATDQGAADSQPVADAAPDASPDAAPDASPAGDAFVPQVDFVCPGAPGCPSDPDTALFAGAAAVPVTDIGFERPRPEYLKLNDCNELQPGGRCGGLTDDALVNCGSDRLCPQDEGYLGPDADGTEGDLTAEGEPAYDYFLDCGLDGLCPDREGYPGPDEGEGDGTFQGLWLAGFGTNRAALGVHDHAWARTVALRQGATLVTLTVVDAVGLFFDDIERIREEAYALLAVEAPEIDIDFVIVSSTHSHELPDTMGQWGGEARGGLPSVTGVVPRYMAHLRARAARSIVDAVLDLRPARLSVGAGSSGVDGLIRDSRAPFIIDDTVGVARLVDAMDATIAVLVNWGNHPEALGSDNNFMTSDFPDALRGALENGLPAQGERPAQPGLGGVAIFVQGCVGGLMTPLGVTVLGADGQPLPEPSFTRAEAIGHRIASVAFAALLEAEAVEAPDLQVTAGSYRIPAENRVLQLAYRLGLISREVFDFNPNIAAGPGNIPKVKTQAAILRLGPLTLYTVPGELFPELAVGGYDGSRSFGHPVVPDDPLAPDLAAAPPPPYLHDIMPGRYRWVVGLGLDEVGYMVPPYDFKLNPGLPYLSEAAGDHYEETNALGPDVVPRTVALLHVLAGALTP